LPFDKLFDKLRQDFKAARIRMHSSKEP